MKIVRPMLASDAADLNSLTYPLLASAKLDGIRCVILKGKALTRSLKPIPNDYIRNLLESHASCLEGFDGELYLHGVGYNEIQSAVMQHEGSPVVTFYLFDNIHRTTSYQEWYDANLSVNLPTPCTVLPQSLIESEQQLREFQKQTLEAGYATFSFISLQIWEVNSKARILIESQAI
jgi:DNA ligase-1